MRLPKIILQLCKSISTIILLVTLGLSIVSLSASAQTAGRDCDGEPLPPGAPTPNCTSNFDLTTPVVPLTPRSAQNRTNNNRNQTPTPNVGSTRVVPSTGQQTQQNQPETLNPCTVGFCIGGLNSSRYTTGTGGQIAMRIIIDIAQIFTFIASAIAILFIVYQGFKMVTSNGDEKRYKEGLQGIQYALIGLVVVVVAYGLIASLVNIIGSLDLNNGGAGSTPVRPTQTAPIGR